VVIYGGAWLFGSRAQSAELATALARLGYTAIAIDYRHAPRYRFPTQINDVRDALAAIANNAHDWDVDPQRVAILGRSAGAELALLAAYDPGPLRIRAAIGYYAPIDLVQGFHVPPRPDPDDVRTVLELYLGGPPALRMNAYAAASPIAHVRPGLPPTLLIGGGRDEVVRLAFSHEMRSVLRSHGDRVVALDLPWSNHAFDTIANGTAGQLARYYTERFLAATL
jgi:acetyl esterase/lipase